MKETLRHREAFEYYYGLGSDRSLSQVARQFNISETNIKEWSRAFQWQNRIFTRDKKIGDELSEKTDIKVIEEKAKMLNTTRAAINQFIKGLKPDRITIIKDEEGNSKEIYVAPVVINTVPDFEKLVKLYLLLIGEGTERLDVEGKIKITEDYKKQLIDKLEAKAERLAVKDDILKKVKNKSEESIERPDDKSNDKTQNSHVEKRDKTPTEKKEPEEQNGEITVSKGMGYAKFDKVTIK